MKIASITFKLNESEKEKLLAIAAKRDVPLSQVLREIVKEYIQEEKK